MNFEEINILELLPQQPPFVMIDRLLYCDLETTKTSLKVSEENIFFDNGVLSDPGLIENIAQTCAAHMGYLNKYTYNNAVNIGFIGAIRNLEIKRLPKVREILITQIKIIEKIFQMILVNATVMIENEKITSCEMKISITDISVEQ